MPMPVEHALSSIGSSVGSETGTPTHSGSHSASASAHPTAFNASAGVVSDQYTGPSLPLPNGALNLTFGVKPGPGQPINDPFASNPVGTKQEGIPEHFGVYADGRSVPATDPGSCDSSHRWEVPGEWAGNATCESDATIVMVGRVRHPCNAAYLKDGVSGEAVGEYGAAVVSIVQDPELGKKVAGEEMPNAAMQRSPERAMQGQIVDERKPSETRTPPRSSVSASRQTPRRRSLSVEDDRESTELLDSPPPLVPVLPSSSTSPPTTATAPAPVQNEQHDDAKTTQQNHHAVVPVPLPKAPPAPIRRPIVRPVQAGLGLGPPSSSSTAPAVCPPASSSGAAHTDSILSMAPPAANVKAPPPVPGPNREGCIQTTVRNPQAVVDERRQFVRCTGPCCDPAAAATLAQQQMQLQMHLMQQQQAQAQQQQVAAKNAPKAAPIMLTPYQHKWLISGQREGEEGKTKYNWMKEFSCTEGHSILPKPINPKRMCSKMLKLNPSDDPKDGTGACSMQ